MLLHFTDGIWDSAFKNCIRYSLPNPLNALYLELNSNDSYLELFSISATEEA